MLRKGTVATMLAVILVMALAGGALAQGYGPGTGTGTPGTGVCTNDLDGDGVCDSFVDLDGDGVNDAAPRNGTGSQYGQGGNGQATSQNQVMGGRGMRGQRMQSQGQAQGQALNGQFIDQNGDGVCDTFVDADGDGVNDAAPRNGTGNQNGGRGHGRQG